MKKNTEELLPTRDTSLAHCLRPSQLTLLDQLRIEPLIDHRNAIQQRSTDKIDWQTYDKAQ